MVKQSRIVSHTLLYALLSCFACASLSVASPTHLASETCSALLLGKTQTADLIAYLSELVRKGVIGLDGLQKFYEHLARGEFVNPIGESEAAMSSTLTIHREGLSGFVKLQGVDQEKLKAWVQATIKERGVAAQMRVASEAETKALKRAIEFVKVPGGTFEIGEGRHPREVELTHSIEVMSTHLTQAQWVKLFGENPSVNQEGPDTVVELAQGKSVTMQPDYPVENITWWSAIVAANKMSEREGYKPVYDLSQVKWISGTRAEDGSLEDMTGTIKINAPDGDVYKAEGYRLPTHCELEHLLRLEFAANQNLALKTRAWFLENGDKQTHPVAQLTPLDIGGRQIYDLVGNVWQWAYDWSGSFRYSGKNPAGPSKGLYRIYHGGSFRSYVNENQYRFGGRESPGKRTCDIGVRFVRTIH